MTTKPHIRCAIYTRKSSEEGLGQEFNSLDAQAEACAAYIASQKHEGWTLAGEPYEDGGVSGGTLDRPGLQRLMTEIDAGRIQMVVVYKIDRLTRSLADFAKLVERLEKAGCSFVSVTQAFNTSSSMGRLTLNVLLSFAQFEREVTAERIRDKIAASKRKGMWMGGTVPLGYDKHPDPNRREIVVNEGEAAQVRSLFRLYDERGCLSDVELEAAERGWRSKRQTFANGATRGGGPLSRGQIHYLLTNTTYRGLIRHKEAVHPGLHPAIVEADLWDRVQARLQEGSARPRGRRGRLATGGVAADAEASTTTGARRGGRAEGRPLRGGRTSHVEATTPAAPLTGKLRDEAGDRLTPTHAVKDGRRMRYYTSSRLLRGEGARGQPDLTASGRSWRLPAGALEAAVAEAIASHLNEAVRACTLLSTPDLTSIQTVTARAQALAAGLRGSDDISGGTGPRPADRDALLRRLLREGRLDAGTLHLDLDPSTVACGLGMVEADLAPALLSLAVPFALRRRGVELKLVAGSTVSSPRPDATLVAALARAHRWVRAMREGRSLTDIARAERTSESYVRTRAALAFLAPRLQAAILAGTQPPDLTLARLIRTGLPLGWGAQEMALGADS